MSSPLNQGRTLTLKRWIVLLSAPGRDPFSFDFLSVAAENAERRARVSALVYLRSDDFTVVGIREVPRDATEAEVEAIVVSIASGF